MTRSKSMTGKCKWCGKEFSAGRIGFHLKTCQARKKAELRDIENPGFSVACMSLLVESLNPDYWFVVELPVSLELYKLDYIVRKLWYDPVDHLRSIIIGGTEFCLYDEGRDPLIKPLNVPAALKRTAVSRIQQKSFWKNSRFDPEYLMKTKLDLVFEPGVEGFYTFDYGSSSQARICCLDRYTRFSDLNENCWRILSRNSWTPEPCELCGKPSDYYNDFADRFDFNEPLYVCKVCKEKALKEGILSKEGALWPNANTPQKADNNVNPSDSFF